MTTNTAALRALADLIDQNGLESATFHVQGRNLYVFPENWANSDLEKSEVRKITRAFGGTWDKNLGTPNDPTMELHQKDVFGHFEATVFFNRAATCERKVLGTEKVIHAAIPARKGYTEEREIIEWDCGSLLSDDAPASTLDASLEAMLESEGVSA